MAQKNIGISLTGGGARGAYQAGSLLALSEILRDEKLLGKENPLRNWSGVSAGAINTAYCASGAENLYESAQRLADIWSNIRISQIFKTDVLSLSKNSVRWIRDLSFGPLFQKKLARSLLDTTPLYELIDQGLHINSVQASLDNAYIDAVAISAFHYKEQRTVSFLQSREAYQWERTRRYSESVTLRSKHIMASCSIPMLFPSTEIEGVYYGDGGFRNLGQLSPIIQMGSEKILIMGVRGPTEILGRGTSEEPGIAELGGMILNALFFDTLTMDIERLRRINDLVKAHPKSEVETEKSEYSVVDYKVLSPSRDIAAIAAQRSSGNFPRAIDFLLKGLGDNDETAELASYILFDSSFTRELVELGYNDTIKEKSDLIDWIQC